jgi:hypothetical protein
MLFFSESKAVVAEEVTRSSLNSDEVKNMWIYTSTPPYVFMA